MEHFNSLDSVHLAGSWVTIGSFDGVHLGHQALVRKVVAGAHAASLLAVVVTFFPHPAVVLRSLQGPFYLMSPQERAAELGRLGVDVVITLPFDRQMAAWSAAEFMHNLSVATNLRRLLVGPGFALGRNRQGDLPALAAIGAELGYTVEEIIPVSASDEIISSSRIRELLLQGQVDQAAALLGRRYAVTGTVIPGDGRGRTIGIPTANLELPEDRLLPGRGVYATMAYLQDQPLLSVSNVGVRPTFENQPVLPRLETHLLDFKGDLYGRQLCLEFVAFLRTEQRFPGIDALVSQIHRDIGVAREVLSHVA